MKDLRTRSVTRSVEQTESEWEDEKEEVPPRKIVVDYFFHVCMASPRHLKGSIHVE